MTIDYGYTAEELLKPERMNGTVRAYYKQRVSDDVLARPGEQDITAHMNFTQVQQIGEEAGLKTEVFLSQERFLSTLLQKEMNEKSGRALSAAERRQFQTLTNPEQMGRTFQVLVQSR
jgi:SAM-dependent MidA family methyltransferase